MIIAIMLSRLKWVVFILDIIHLFFFMMFWSIVSSILYKLLDDNRWINVPFFGVSYWNDQPLLEKLLVPQNRVAWIWIDPA
jgi:hypothetical protein